MLINEKIHLTLIHLMVFYSRWLSLFPLLMSELSKQSRVTVDAETISGLAYCDQIISFLCNIQISAGDAVAFSGILRELELPLTSVNRLVDGHLRLHIYNLLT